MCETPSPILYKRVKKTSDDPSSLSFSDSPPDPPSLDNSKVHTHTHTCVHAHTHTRMHTHECFPDQDSGIADDESVRSKASSSGNGFKEASQTNKIVLKLISPSDKSS